MYRYTRYSSLLLSMLISLCGGTLFASEGNISPTEKHAWSENAGWLDFRPDHGGVTVHADHLSGYTWAENMGWLKLGSDGGGPYANTSPTNWGVNRDGSGNLSGYAWSETTGWINFNPVHSQVTIDPSTGSFDGYAWGENCGWVHFKGTSPAYNVRTLGDAPWITKIEPNRIPRGNSCPIRVRITGTNFPYLATDLYSSDPGISGTIIWPDTPNENEVIIEVYVDSNVPTGVHQFQIQTSQGIASEDIDVFDRGPQKPLGGAYVWVNGWDYGPWEDHVDSPAEQMLNALDQIQKVKANPFGIKDLLFHTARYEPLMGDYQTFLETMLIQAHLYDLRVHAWCKDFQGEGPEPFDISTLLLPLQEVVDWNDNHTQAQQFDGIHVNIEHPKSNKFGAIDGDAYEVSQFFAEADALVGDLFFSQSPGYNYNWDRWQHLEERGQDFCNQSQFVDLLIPQMYIVGRCGSGFPDCFVFQDIASEMVSDLPEMVDQKTHLIAGLNATDPVFLFNIDPSENPLLYEFRKDAETSDNFTSCPNFEISQLGPIVAQTDFSNSSGLLSSEFDFGFLGCWPDPDNSNPSGADTIMLHQRTQVPSSISGSPSLAYWHFETMNRGTFQSVTVGTGGANSSLQNNGTGNRVFSFFANLIGTRSTCLIQVEIYDPLGGLFTTAEFGPGETLVISVESAQEGLWDFVWSTDCGVNVDVTYQIDEDRILETHIIPYEFYSELLEWPTQSILDLLRFL